MPCEETSQNQHRENVIFLVFFLNMPWNYYSSPCLFWTQSLRHLCPGDWVIPIFYSEKYCNRRKLQGDKNCTQQQYYQLNLQGKIPPVDTFTHSIFSGDAAQELFYALWFRSRVNTGSVLQPSPERLWKRPHFLIWLMPLMKHFCWDAFPRLNMRLLKKSQGALTSLYIVYNWAILHENINSPTKLQARKGQTVRGVRGEETKHWGQSE